MSPLNFNNQNFKILNWSAPIGIT